MRVRRPGEAGVAVQAARGEATAFGGRRWRPQYIGGGDGESGVGGVGGDRHFGVRTRAGDYDTRPIMWRCGLRTWVRWWGYPRRAAAVAETLTPFGNAATRVGGVGLLGRCAD